MLALLVPGEAAGQQGAGELRQLAGHLGPGDGVYVRVTNGSRVKADVSHPGPDSLTLSNGLTLAEEDILSIELQDSLWEGAAIGLGVGAALLATRPVGSDSAAAVVKRRDAPPGSAGRHWSVCRWEFPQNDLRRHANGPSLAYGDTGRIRRSTVGGLVSLHLRGFPVAVQGEVGRARGPGIGSHAAVLDDGLGRDRAAPR